MRRLLPQVRNALRPLLDLENRVRRFLTEGARSYQELEQLVMRPFDPKDKILVEPRHWYWDPKGRHFLRFELNGFARTRVLLWVPRPIKACYDARGRIESLESAGQWRISVQYDDAVEPWRCPREPRWLAYRFTAVRFERPDLSKAHTAEVNGWLFVTEKRASSTGGVRVASRAAVSPFQREPSWIGRWIDRVDEANQTRREIDSYRERAEWAGRVWQRQPSTDSLFDREHYVHGVRDAIRGTSAERIEWIAETHANAAEAAAHAINVLDTLPTESYAEYYQLPSQSSQIPARAESPHSLPSPPLIRGERVGVRGDSKPTHSQTLARRLVYDPSAYVATPGSSGGQRLLLSRRVS